MESTVACSTPTVSGRDAVGANRDDAPLDALAQYMRGVHHATPLTADEESHLIEQVARWNRERRADGGLPLLPAYVRTYARARARLVEGYQPFVIHAARRLVWRCEHLTLLDLIQEGNVGLLQALNAYDGGHSDAAFRSWVGDWIRGALRAAYWRSERSLHIPARTGRALLRLETVGADLLQQLGREPTGEELAEALGLPLADVRELLALRAQRVVSLHVLPQMPGDDTDEGGLPSDEAVWTAAEQTSPAPGAIAAGFDRLHEALDQLPLDERRVVALRYGFVDGREHSQVEVAELLDLPCALVPVLDRRAQFYLRRLLSGAGWDGTAAAVA